MKSFLSLLMSLQMSLFAIVPYAPEPRVDEETVVETYIPKDQKDYEVGEYAFKVLTDNGDNIYFDEIKFDLKTALSKFPSNYLFQDVEVAVRHADGKLVNVVGAKVDANTKIVEIDLGSANIFREGKVYEVVYRIAFTVLTSEVQYIKSDWKSYDDGKSGLGKTMFLVEQPNPVTPETSKGETYSYVTTALSHNTKKKSEGTTTNGIRTGLHSNTLVITDSTNVLLNHTTDAWYAQRFNREIISNGKNLGDETFFGDINNFRQFKKEFIHDVSGDFYKFNTKVTTVFDELRLGNYEELFTAKDTYDTYILKSPFESLFKVKFEKDENLYSVTVELKDEVAKIIGGSDTETSTTEDKMAYWVENSVDLFGFDLKKPTFEVVADNKQNFTADAIVVENLGTKYSMTFNGDNPVVKIGYPDMKVPYSITKQIGGNVNVLLPNISEVNANRLVGGVFQPQMIVKEYTTNFKFPTNDSFDWNAYKRYGTDMEVFIIDNAKYNLTEYDEVIGKVTETDYIFKSRLVVNDLTDIKNEIDDMKITREGKFLIGIKIKNNFGDEFVTTKQFDVANDLNFSKLPIENNLSITLDDKSISYNGTTKEHGVNLLVDNSLKLIGAYSYSNGKTLIGRPSVDLVDDTPNLKMFNESLKEVSFDNIIAKTVRINRITEYKNGFLIATEMGVYYYDGTKDEMILVGDMSEDTLTVQQTSGLVYYTTRTTLGIGRITDGAFEKLYLVALSDISDNTTNIQSVNVDSNYIYIYSNTSSDTTPTLTILKK